ncbi:MAG: hypothetical protein HQK58_13535, partial [Deltaproteobacteria bacterium]|nr:hypothetical protein [Deltaproteobacteria bacterium]
TTPVKDTPKITPPPQAAAPVQEIPHAKRKPSDATPIKKTLTAEPAPQTVAPAQEAPSVSMSRTSKPGSKVDAPVGVPKAPKKAAKESLPPEELVPHLLKTLDEQTTTAGLTYGDVGAKCKIAWRRGLALATKTGDAEKGTIGAEAIARFIYPLWEQGQVVIQPANPGKAGGWKTPRIWSLTSGRAKFSKIFQAAPATPGEIKTKTPPPDKTTDVAALKRAYDKYAPEYLGYVPIYLVRRELGWLREKFDDLLRNLCERDEPVIILMRGDMQHYTEDEKKDSLRRGNILYMQVRWRAS